MFREEQVEQAIIEGLQGLGYENLYGPDIEREYNEVILKDTFYDALFKINPDITMDIAEEVYRKIINFNNIGLVLVNYEFYHMLYAGVEVPIEGDRTYTAKLIDRENIDRNIFNAINQYTVVEYKEKRPDVVVFINGIPLVVFELKSATREDTSIENAFNQIKNYQQDIRSLFYYNSFNVISDGINARIGTITADFKRYMTWKSKDGERAEENINQIDYLLNGVFRRDRFIDLITNFILFQNKDGKDIKILAGYHQYFAVKKSVLSTENALESHSRKAGVVWHTQGSGKSFVMVFYAGLLLKNIKLSNPTIVLLTDRNDLDNQLFTTFVNCNREILPQSCKQAESRDELKELLKVNAGGIVFTTIQKFEESDDVLSDRENIIFIADEAHRSQYGLDKKFDKKTGDFKIGYAKKMRDALPNATFIGFTGTPIEIADKSTRLLFGDYIDIYDMTQAVLDNATVPIYYENRVAKLKLNENILKELDAEYNYILTNKEATEETVEQSKEELAKLETIIGSNQRLEMLAEDIVSHYGQRQDILNGKAMIVCMSRKIAIDLYRYILMLRKDWKEKVKLVLTDNNNDPEGWHDLVGNKQYRDNLAIDFKNENSEFKIVIVVDMWLTGFDVPDLVTMYIDKPMKGHNLMQAIARVNRVYKDKEAGLIVDYIGIGADLRIALNEYTNRDRDKIPDITSAYVILREKLEIMRDMFYGFDYSKFFDGSNKERLNILSDGINYVLSKTEDDKKEFVKEATALLQAETLSRSLLDERTKLEVEYFKSVKVGVYKITGTGKLTTTEVNQRILNILEQAIQEDGIVDLFKASERNNPEISILSDEYISGIKNMKNKNIATELLKKLLEGNIKIFQRTNLVKSELFSQKIENIMKKYNNRLITSAEVIEELLNLSQEIIEARNEGQEKGLSEDEYAFYDALVKDPSVLKDMEDEILIQLAHELTETVRKNRTVDWDKKESAKAFMRKEVKRLLRKYHYPPTKADEAVQTVIKQAELMSENI
ncbi:MAG: type I restriction endonuclease subunit R [Endomicrobiaceae bacterium]|nr:type I restriction endonuclease subunit R [Endomicrobiaceae bacterium]MDD3922534.1 type I restriction endonuclease subunit R [Endomicrobiaceae bacterium]